MAKLHESFTNKANAIGISMEIINSKLDEMNLETGCKYPYFRTYLAMYVSNMATSQQI